MALSSRDLRKIIDIVDVVHSVPDPPAMFRVVCEKLQKYIGLSGGAFSYPDPQTGEFQLNGCESFDNLGAVLLYISHYARQDPFVRSGWLFNKKHLNITARNTDLLPGNAFARHEFTCDFLLPVANVYYSVAGTLASQGDVVARVGFHRQKRERNFSAREKEIIDLLLPYMARAIHIRTLRNRNNSGRERNAVIGIGGDGKPFCMNQEAKQLLDKIPLESIPDPGMKAEPAFYRSRSGTYRVRTMPLGSKRKGKVVLLERCPPEHRLHPLLTDLKLSRRESEVAAQVVQGYSNREIAEQLFICEQTVKDHLHSAFEKLEIRRRGELTAKVLGLRARQTSP